MFRNFSGKLRATDTKLKENNNVVIPMNWLHHRQAKLYTLLSHFVLYFCVFFSSTTNSPSTHLSSSFFLKMYPIQIGWIINSRKILDKMTLSHTDDITALEASHFPEWEWIAFAFLSFHSVRLIIFRCKTIPMFCAVYANRRILHRLGNNLLLVNVLNLSYSLCTYFYVHNVLKHTSSTQIEWKNFSNENSAFFIISSESQFITHRTTNFTVTVTTDTVR